MSDINDIAAIWLGEKGKPFAKIKVNANNLYQAIRGGDFGLVVWRKRNTDSERAPDLRIKIDVPREARREAAPSQGGESEEIPF